MEALHLEEKRETEKQPCHLSWHVTPIKNQTQGWVQFFRQHKRERLLQYSVNLFCNGCLGHGDIALNNQGLRQKSLVMIIYPRQEHQRLVICEDLNTCSMYHVTLIENF